MYRINQQIAILLARQILPSLMTSDQVKCELKSFAALGVSYLLPFGTKLHIRRRGAVYYYYISGYAHDGADVSKALATAGCVVEDGKVKQIVSWLPSAPVCANRLNYLTCNGEPELVIKGRMIRLMYENKHDEAVGLTEAAIAAQKYERNSRW